MLLTAEAIDTAQRHERDGVCDARAWLPYRRVQSQLERADGALLKALETLVAIPAEALAPDDVETIEIEIERAHALRHAGRADEAAAAARRALAWLQALAPPYTLPHREAAAWGALAAAELALGHRDEARTAYTSALTLRRGHDSVGSLWSAQDERALASTGPSQRTAKPRFAPQ